MRIQQDVWVNKVPKILEFLGTQYEVPNNEWVKLMKIIIEQLLKRDEKLMIKLAEEESIRGTSRTWLSTKIESVDSPQKVRDNLFFYGYTSAYDIGRFVDKLLKAYNISDREFRIICTDGSYLPPEDSYEDNEDKNKSIVTESNVWIFATPESNFEVAVQKGIWAYKKQGTANKIQKGDILIFYITGSTAFAAIATVESEWYQASDIVWTDEIWAKEILYPFQIKIKIIQQGRVNARELVNNLSFITMKEKWGMFFKGAPANRSTPIPESDYKIILNAFTNEKQQPLSQLVNLKNKEIDKEIKYFILRTGSGGYTDVPEKIYNFKSGIPGSIQLRDAANNAKFVYLEKGKFYGVGEIGEITPEKRDDGDYFNAQIKNYQKIDEIESSIVNSIPGLNLTQAGIKQITKEEFESIF